MNALVKKNDAGECYDVTELDLSHCDCTHCSGLDWNNVFNEAF